MFLYLYLRNENMGTNGDSSDLSEQIDLSDNEISGRPVFAASGNNLFIAFFQDNKIKLKFSRDRGENLSPPQDLMTLQGNANFLRINAKDNIAVVVVVEQTNSQMSVKGVSGTLVDGNYVKRECPKRTLEGNIAFNDILDVAIRINDDTSSDDFVFIKNIGGAAVTATGHHPHAPT